jgi:hypothetical protein
MADAAPTRAVDSHKPPASHIKFDTWLTLALTLGTWAAVAISLWVALDQHKATERQIQALEDQHNDARELLRVQISDELDKDYDSTEMRKARRQEAAELLATPEHINEDRVLDFFEKVGMYLQQNRIDEDTVYESFATEIEHYWLAHDSYVKRVRAESHDNTIYDRFESLYLRMLSHDAKERHESPDQVRPTTQDITVFLGYEKNLTL